jgi:hypothetical protein
LDRELREARPLLRLVLLLLALADVLGSDRCCSMVSYKLVTVILP